MGGLKRMDAAFLTTSPSICRGTIVQPAWPLPTESAGLLEMYRHVWETPPRLLHGDWLPEHVLVRNDAVVGIIDFGNTRSGDPAYDIAYWQFFWDADLYTTSVLLDGYRHAGDTGQSLDLRVHLCR